jgi:hypothetical protein
MHKILTVELELDENGKVEKVCLRHQPDTSSVDLTQELAYQDVITRGWMINYDKAFRLFIQEEEIDQEEEGLVAV